MYFITFRVNSKLVITDLNLIFYNKTTYYDLKIVYLHQLMFIIL